MNRFRLVREERQSLSVAVCSSERVVLQSGLASLPWAPVSCSSERVVLQSGLASLPWAPVAS